ncbi:hypothetical protein [Paenibacillus sp. CMAA1364]
MQQSRCSINDSNKHLQQICDIHYTLRREDILWVLHYVQQKLAQGEPALLDLPKPRLLRNFKYFSKISLLLLSHTGTSYLEQEEVRTYLREALYGLIPLCYSESNSS